MTGKECHVRVMRTVRHWNPCVCWPGDRRGNPRHNFKWDSCTGDLLRFFGPSAEHEWIAAFQPNDLLSFVRFVDQQRANFLLGMAFTGLFADINDFCVVSRPAKSVRICQMIVNDDVSTPDTVLCA